ncbi:TetR/AcrR family transcriptional regulator [Spongisporangium articulatum]|uniref:TetR/AcrR family transcriptional regulator n=1 Tax=Spongisporangium articulatum TaxID=3362603 RepID=A0ABW8AQB2_9ACTN
MATPYEQTGRTHQKARTREALLEAARRILTSGHEPTVEEAAAEAKVSRTTAYRYFPTRQSLVLAAHPQTLQTSLLPDDAPSDTGARLDLVMQAFTELTLTWEPQLRAALRASLEPGSEPPTLRGGRAIGWIADALSPLRGQVDVDRLAVAIRSATGVETFVWLVDVAGLSRDDAAHLMRWSAAALLNRALDGDPPP